MACDSAVTRVLVTRQPTQDPGRQPIGSTEGHSHGGHHHPDSLSNGGDATMNGVGDSQIGHQVGGGWDGATGDPGWDGATGDPGWDGDPWNGGTDSGAGGLAGRLRAAIRLLPVALGGAPTQPLEVGRASRVVSAAQRSALLVRDGGCVFPDCGRPPSWCDAHHLNHWLHGGPTDLGNLVLLCRAHHRAVHEGGWQLHRDPDGRFTATQPHRRSTAA